MVTDTDQNELDMIPSSAVPFESPRCTKHNRYMKVKETIRNPQPTHRILNVVRKCYCEACRSEGNFEYKNVSNSIELRE